MRRRLYRGPWHREIVLFLATYAVYGLARPVASDVLDSHLDVAGNLAVGAAGAALLVCSLRRRHLPTRPRMELPC